MSIRNLNRLFRPESVALIGASNRAGSIGNILVRNMRSAGYEGALWPVNPKYRRIEGLQAYKNPGALPEPADLAVICTPPHTVPELAADLAERGTKGLVVITAGIEQGADANKASPRQQILDAARPQLMRVVGPNCLGILVPPVGLNASFAQLSPNPGHVAFVAQSGAIVTSIIDWATPRGIGFSHLVSLGEMADVDLGDMLDYLANDRGTHSILLYIEAVTHARKFMSAARAAARMKPVIVVKAGRFPAGAEAAASHTGALAGADDVYDAAFRRAGMLRVVRLEELFDAVQILARGARPKGDRLAVLTNGGGLGVLAADALAEEGGQLAQLNSDTFARLDEVLPATWSRANPVDIIGDADGERYANAIDATARDPGVDALLAIHCPTATVSSIDAARAVVERVGSNIALPLLTSWVGESSAREARQFFEAQGWPAFETPEDAVQAFMYLVRHARNQEALMETPPSIPEAFTPDTDSARAVIEHVLSSERKWLTEPEAKAVLSAFGIACVPTRVATSASQAADIAGEFYGPVALKILSPDITHKSDVGGVALGLSDPQAVLQAAETMLERVAKARPDALIEGLTISPMVSRPRAFELITGIKADRQFGPVILFGQGGTAVEHIDDKALGLPPLNMHLAREIVSRTRIARLLAGYRDQPPANNDAIAMTLIRLAQIAIDLPEVTELDINPLLADPTGVLALDARIRVEATDRAGEERLCIRPYPKALETTVPLGDGRVLLLRPIRPEDETSLQRAFLRLDPQTVRLRFFVPIKELNHVQAARFTQLDYDRDMALVLTEPGIAGKTEIYGVVRLSADPDNERAEYAIVIGRELTGMGLGVMLMRHIIDYARDRGIGEIFGDVLRQNSTMLKVCDFLGFRRDAVPDEPEIVRVTLELNPR